MTADPRIILAETPMIRARITAVIICVFLTALDGFDVLAISFASPGIAEEWGINRAALGIVLSIELIGMAVGSVLLGNLADRFGRRPTILVCLFLMTIGMFLATQAVGVITLSAIRLVTGLGIGGMLASTNAMVAEYSNTRHRNLAVALMAAGYPFGAIIGGSISAQLLTAFDWRSVFLLGSFATAIFIPIVWFLLPESISYLMRSRPADAMAKINRIMQSMGHRAVESLPPLPTHMPKAGITQLFRPGLARTTMLLTLAYFTHIMTFYFILKWIPKIVVDMGFSPTAASNVLVWANVGGAGGALLLSLLTKRFNVRALVVGALILAAIMVAVFGTLQSDLTQLTVVASIAVFFTNSAIVGLFAILAQSFPTEVRAGGTGFVIGVGRGGAASGPIVAGFLFAHGHGLQAVATIMAMGSLLAAVALMLVRYRESEDFG